MIYTETCFRGLVYTIKLGQLTDTAVIKLAFGVHSTPLSAGGMRPPQEHLHRLKWSIVGLQQPHRADSWSPCSRADSPSCEQGLGLSFTGGSLAAVKLTILSVSQLLLFHISSLLGSQLKQARHTHTHTHSCSLSALGLCRDQM